MSQTPARIQSAAMPMASVPEEHALTKV